MKALRNLGIKMGLISPTLKEAQRLFKFPAKPKSMMLQSNLRLKLGNSIQTVRRIR